MPSASHEIERGAISLGGQVTVKCMRSGNIQVKHKGVYVGYVTKLGYICFKATDTLPRVTRDAMGDILQRVERQYGNGTCN